MIKGHIRRLTRYVKNNHRAYKIMLWGFGCLLVLGIILLTIAAENQGKGNQSRKVKMSALKELAMVRANLESELSKSLYQLGALVAYIAVNPDIAEEDFNVFAHNLFQQESHIISLGVAPDMIVKYVYPYERNKAALGLDYSKTDDQRDLVLRARKTGRMVLAGPLTSVQGHYVLIARAPVYLAENFKGKKTGSFWGIVSVLIDATSLFDSVGVSRPEYDISLRGKDAKGGEGAFFFGNPDSFDDENAVLSVSVPGGSWQISATPKEVARSAPREIIVIRLIGLVLCLTVLVVIVIRLRYLEERWATEEKLEKALLEAERASRAKSEFLANMSHELRTPLNAIIGFSDLIRDSSRFKASQDKIVEYAGDINESGHHLLRIINDILDLSKVEAGNFSTITEPVYIQEIAEQSLRLTRNAMLENNLSVSNMIAADLPPLQTDERLLKQIFLNLLSNAVKFTPTGGRVTLTAELLQDEQMRIKLTDTGIGMSKEDLVIALQNFGQAGSYLARSQQGTGLGLPLVKAFVELLGGALEINSEVGVGTDVIITFPATCVLKTPQVATLSYSI